MSLLAREATIADLDLLVKHRRGMWIGIGDDYTSDELDAADPVYAQWAHERLATGELAGVIVELDGAPIASGCVWLQPIQPRPLAVTVQPYILSMFTEPAHRGKGHARAVVDGLIAWCEKRGLDASITLHAAPLGRRVYEAAGFERTYEMRRERSTRV